MENKNLPRDVFLYLLSIVALGMLAVNFGALLFQFINIYVPDAIADQYQSASSYFQSVRWEISTLVIVFPVFLWVSRYLNRDLEANPEKRELKIRKWLLYLTLFVAGVVVIGDLIALVYNFLQGELTRRFVLKVLSIFVVAGSVFYYYVHELRERVASTKLFSRIVVAVVTAGIIAGFIVAGSPQAQRYNRFDERRVSDLQGIQWQVAEYWRLKRALPTNLDALTDNFSGYKAPLDPQTNQPYEYRTTGSLSFQLCANFKTDNPEANPYGPRGASSVDSYGLVSNWAHGEGKQCFDRTIDPDKFPNPKI
jgi:hypothetical protein